ncbi:MAG TPA: hypothetical protein VMT73_05555 [Anaerolineales bacterium]|nr:hypothetical protein [Anaerolineales bacterium]
MFSRIPYILEWILFGAIWAVVLTYASPPPTDEIEQVRAYTRQIEFDYVNWMLNAMGVKIQQGAAGLPGYLSNESRKEIVTEYLSVTQNIMNSETALDQIYADATIKDKDAAAKTIRADLAQEYARQNQLAPLTEAILQEQVSQVLSEQGLTLLGQTIPSVLFHSTPVPNALVVSKRNVIEQIANISVSPDLTIDQQADLESRVDAGLNVSSLVVPIGGVGVYPTMIMRTTSLQWLLSTIAHEWTHNYLTLRPLGALYDQSPELRTMNETTADMTGNEIGALVIKEFYPQLSTASLLHDFNLISLPQDHPAPGTLPRPPFDFRAEMHTTRVTVDALLAEGKIDEAEAYMRDRQQIFLRNGYLIRKLNQAYFAFYGAYADVPGGAAGNDPVGGAVRELRAESPTLADFVNRISWMTSYDELKKVVSTQ